MAKFNIPFYFSIWEIQSSSVLFYYMQSIVFASPPEMSFRGSVLIDQQRATKQSLSLPQVDIILMIDRI